VWPPCAYHGSPCCIVRSACPIYLLEAGHPRQKVSETTEAQICHPLWKRAPTPSDYSPSSLEKASPSPLHAACMQQLPQPYAGCDDASRLFSNAHIYDKMLALRLLSIVKNYVDSTWHCHDCVDVTWTVQRVPKKTDGQLQCSWPSVFFHVQLLHVNVRNLVNLFLRAWVVA
jgi:hypothetical protein